MALVYNEKHFSMTTRESSQQKTSLHLTPETALEKNPLKLLFAKFSICCDEVFIRSLDFEFYTIYSIWINIWNKTLLNPCQYSTHTRNSSTFSRFETDQNPACRTFKPLFLWLKSWKIYHLASLTYVQELNPESRSWPKINVFILCHTKVRFHCNRLDLYESCRQQTHQHQHVKTKDSNISGIWICHIKTIFMKPLLLSLAFITLMGT